MSGKVKKPGLPSMLSEDQRETLILRCCEHPNGATKETILRVIGWAEETLAMKGFLDLVLRGDVIPSLTEEGDDVLFTLRDALVSR